MVFVRLLIVCVLLLLSGCQSFTIHITANGIPPEQLEKLKSELLTVADEVKETELNIPKEFPNTVIASNPGYFNYGKIAAIQDMLWNNELGVATELKFAQGLHFYNNGHIGLYLRHPDLQDIPLMPPYLRTQYCEFADATIQFYKTGKFELEYENPEDVTGVMLTQQGNWLYDGSRLSLTSENGVEVQSFILSQENKETQWGPRPADVFTPMQDTSFAPLKCEFLIIYVQQEPI